MKKEPVGNNEAGRVSLMKGYMKPPTVRERAKYRAAKEAGLLERVLEVGWAGLTAKESGRIGGMLAHRQDNDMEM